MENRYFTSLIAVIVLAILAFWLALPVQHPAWLERIIAWQKGPIELKKGLDLQGGLQVLLEADLPPDQPVDRESMSAAKTIVENRVNGLGVTEPLVQLQGSRRIVVELPGINNPDEAIATLKGTGLLEFIDAGNTFLPEGTVVRTDFPGGGGASTSATVTNTASITETGTITTTSTVTGTAAGPEGKIYHTVMTGRALKSASVGYDRLTGEPIILFQLKKDGAETFAKFTSENVGKILAIVLDKKVISSPRINSPIPNGEGQITGNFTQESAKSLAVQLRYGALPVPLKVVETRAVGSTLGEDSVQ
ncbi:MAG TPA: protein translocase subunit SecD, partial [Anaerolineae bacterium]|nr:protein translocase subunit SecD [Anaerolineae bacterium]